MYYLISFSVLVSEIVERAISCNGAFLESAEMSIAISAIKEILKKKRKRKKEEGTLVPCFFLLKFFSFQRLKFIFANLFFFLLFFVVVGNYVVDFEKSVASISTKSVYGK